MNLELIRKLEAMADPARNPNEHERAVARSKLEQLTKTYARPRYEDTAAYSMPLQFGVARYAEQHGLDARALRRKLRSMGKSAPYSMRDVEEALSGLTRR